MKKILFINPFGIGDVLFTTPAIRAIKDNLPDAKISYWCNQRLEGLLRNNPDIEKIFALSRGDLKKIYNESVFKGLAGSLSLFYELKKEKFDISLDFSSERHYSLICKLLGIKKRIGFNYKNRGVLLTDKIETDGYNSKHVVEYYLDLIKPLGIKPKTFNLELNIPETVKAKGFNLLKHAGVSERDIVIGIAPGAGASWGKDASLKHWPALRFAQLADKIIDNLGAKVVILGDESERPIADVIVNAMRNRAIGLVAKTNLEDLSAIISNLRLLIANDGGPLHIAAAEGVKTVSIFGPVDDLVYGPYPPAATHIVLKKDLSCRPCYRNFKMPLCASQRECINSISVDEVFEAIGRLL